MHFRNILKHRKKLLYFAAAVFFLILVEMYVFDREYLLYKLAGLKQQTYSLRDGVPYAFKLKHAKALALNNDPNITYENIDSLVSSISLKCKNAIPGPGQVFYSNDGEQFNESHSLHYQAETDYYQRLLVFPSTTHISDLRFDLTNVQGDVVVCREIVINPHPDNPLSVFRMAFYAIMLGLFAVVLAWDTTEPVERLIHSLEFQSLAIAGLAILLVFPDVLLMGNSLRITDQFNGEFQALFPKEFYPQAAHSQWMDHYYDPGGALYQSEPMMQFMLRSFRNGDSPYWNPYSAAGALGPETLIDNKFSVFTLAYVLLGGGSLVYTLLLLFFQFWGAYFIFRLAREKLALSILAASAGTIVYLLNGYAVANLGSNTAQGYLFIPLCLYASFSFLEKTTAARICWVILSFAALLSFTFIPSTVTNVIAIYGVLIGYAFTVSRKNRTSPFTALWKLVAHGSCLLAAILLLAFIYLPLVENMASTGTFSAYAARHTTPSSWIMIPSIFTPSHFFELYKAMEVQVMEFASLTHQNWVAFHFGVTALAFAICAISFRRREHAPLVFACLATILLGLAPVFGIPGLSSLIDRLPIVSGFSNPYWWPMIVIPIIVLVPIGVDNLQNRVGIPALTFLLLAVLIISLVAVGRVYGLREPNIDFKKWSIIIAILSAALVSVFIFISSFLSNNLSRNRILTALVIFMFIELSVDAKVIRYPQNDMFASPAAEIPFIKENIGLYRTLTITPLSQNFGLRPELGSAYGIQEVTSINQGTFPSYMEYFHKALPLDPTQREYYNYYPSLRDIQDTPDLNPINWPAIDELGVKYILLTKAFIHYHQALLDHGLKPVFETSSVVVYENPNVLPRAFTIDLQSGQDNQPIMLTSDVSSKLKPSNITLYRNAEVRLEGDVNRDSLLVLTDNWHADWTAYVNGVETPIQRVDGTFRGVKVPAGHYEVRMVYQPDTLKAAILCTVLMILFLLYLLLDRHRINRWLANGFGKLQA
jgi:hypothetical protein